MTLGGQVVNFPGPGFLNEPDQIGGIGQIAVMHEKARRPLMGVVIEMVDPGAVEGGGAALYAVNLVALGEQQFRQQGRPSCPVTPVMSAILSVIPARRYTPLMAANRR